MNTFENSNGGLLGSDSHSGKGGAGNDLFALTDEQILEIGPESAGENSGSEEGQQDDHVQQEESGRTAPAQASHATTTAARKSADADSHPTQENSAAAVAVAAEPPTWLADLMADPQRGTEARALWQGVERERQEAAAYREVFAEPAAARAAAERARALDEIDRAYFAGDAVERSKLAATMLREDPAAFREMVLEGLRALDEAEKSGGGLRSAGDSRLARVFGGARAGAALNAATSSAPSTGADGTGVAGHHGAARRDAHQDAQMAAYASFEKSANEDLERSVGVAIDRTLSPALPNSGRDDDGALKSRLVGAVRHDVEKALQSDRQLSERVAQLLSGKRLNDDTRAQVVRLIGERAEQLVPGAAKRILQDWTRTTLAAHREKTGRSAAAAARPEVATVSGGGRGPGESGKTAERGPDSAAGRAVDYRKLSDEQILAM